MRLGRGFTAEELKAAGVPLKLAKSIGIAVDARRVNKSVESLQRNISRLLEYKSKLVLFPKRKLAAPKKGEASVAEQAAATQLKGTPLPLVKAAPVFPFAKVEPGSAFSTLRIARVDAKLVGIREKQKKEKAAAASEKKDEPKE